MSNEADDDKDAAKLYIREFYDIKEIELNTIKSGMDAGALIFVTAMNEKEIKPMGRQVFEAAFGLVITALPGGIYLSKTWKALVDARPTFAARAQFLQAVGYDAANRAHGVISGSASGGGKTQFSVQLAVYLESLYGTLARGRAALHRERYAMERYLPELKKQPGGSLEAKVRYALGDLPPLPTVEQQKLLIKMYQYELFKRYCAANVRVYKTNYTAQYGFRSVDAGQSDLEVKGLNSGQLEHIYEQFGNKKMSEEKAKRVIAGAMQLFTDANKRAEFGRLIRQSIEQNIETQSPMWPINGPQDIVRHWGAKMIIKQDQLQPRFGGLG